MEQEDEYRKAVALLAKLGQSEGKEATIDLSALFSPPRRAPGSTYRELVSELNSLPGRRVTRPEEPLQPRASSEAQLQVGAQKAAGHEAEMARRAGEVKEELEGAFRKLKAAPGREAVVSGAAEKLVLPGLSLADQAEELGRIITGLREGAFSGGQLEIVGEELRGLARASKGEGVVGEEPLLSLRDQRLREALALLGGAAADGGA